MSILTAQQIGVQGAGATRNHAVSFADWLDSGELLSGTPTITEVTTSDLTITNKAISTATLTINGISVATAAAVQMTVAGGTAGTTYVIKILVATDATAAQTLEAYTTLRIEGA